MALLLQERAAAQTSVAQGIISDYENGQAMPGANFVLTDIDDPSDVRGASADANGFYRLSGIVPGEYILTISFVGYVPYTDTLQIGPDETLAISRAIRQDTAELGEVVVSRSTGAGRLEGGLQRITAEDISRVPTPAGGGDLAGYLQALPGVVTTGDRGGGLFIRGGRPSENQVMIDGTLIYQPFHIVSFFSAFPEQIIAGADFYAGGYGSRFSSRMSSVLDIRMRNGNRFRARGMASVSPFVAEVMAEGPIKQGTSSWIASARSSLIEQTSGHYMPETYPLKFDSQYFKIVHSGSNDSRCSALFMRTYDRGKLDFDRNEAFSWGNLVFGGQCVILPDDSSVLFDANIGVSHTTNQVNSGFASERFSDATRLHIDVNVTQFSGDIRLNYGIFTHLMWLNFDTSELFLERRQDDPQMLGTGAYLDATFALRDNLRITPGFATSMYRFYYPFTLEPRLRFTWEPFGSDDQQLNGALGIYRQPLAGIGDMRDAGAAFTAWMPTPIGEAQMGAMHMILGWTQTLSRSLNFSIEAYHKQLRNMAIPVWSTLATFTSELSLADGRVYGADARVEYNRRPLYAFLGYGYSWTEYESAQDHFSTWFGEPVQRFHPPHDRRHQINAMATLSLGEYDLSVRWQFGSGLPYTQPFGFDELFYYYDHLPDVQYEFGLPRVILDRPFGARMPAYHRMDISVERTFNLRFAELALQAGAINVYDRTNLFYYDVYNHRRVDQLPFAPFVSLKLDMQ